MKDPGYIFGVQLAAVRELPFVSCNVEARNNICSIKADGISNTADSRKRIIRPWSIFYIDDDNGISFLIAFINIISKISHWNLELPGG